MNKTFLIIIGVVVVFGIVLYSNLFLGDIENQREAEREAERQAWMDKMQDGMTDCKILEKTGASPNEVERCALELFKTVRQDCMKYLSPEACEELESIIDEQDLRNIFP